MPTALQEYEAIKAQLSYNKHANADTSLEGLLAAQRRGAHTLQQRRLLSSTAAAERKIKLPQGVTSVVAFMMEIESLGHPPLAAQPEELTVQLYEHQR